ncbi:ATP-dependent DNA helicase Q-like 4A isoform X2 [Malus domestica]
MVNSSDARVLDGSLSNNSVHTSQGKDSAEVFVNDLDDDDDDILENIDVDQIVEQYQSSCTPQPSSFKLPPITPFIDKDNRQEATSLPPELCSNCSHGFKIGLCPEAGSHLQEMKDTLIIISNQLLDDVNDLSPEQINKLRQDRFIHIMSLEDMKDVIHHQFHSLLLIGLVSHLVLLRRNHAFQSLLKLTTLKVPRTKNGVVIIFRGPISWRMVTRKCLEITLSVSTKERSLMLR